MDSFPHQSLVREIAGAMAWWQDAGVDHDYLDEPARWLTSPETGSGKAADLQAGPDSVTRQTGPATSPVEVPRIGGPAGDRPKCLPDFRNWCMTEASLAIGASRTRIPPRGKAGADLMIVVEQPEAGDNDALLSGPQGRFLEAIVNAMGLTSDRIYLASALPHAMPMPDWKALNEAGLGEILIHHIVLAAPRRLITFGNGIPSLLGNDPTQSSPILPALNQEGRTTPLLTERSLVALTRGKAKAGFWRRWLEWTGA